MLTGSNPSLHRHIMCWWRILTVMRRRQSKKNFGSGRNNMLFRVRPPSQSLSMEWVNSCTRINVTCYEKWVIKLLSIILLLVFLLAILLRRCSTIQKLHQSKHWPSWSLVQRMTPKQCSRMLSCSAPILSNSISMRSTRTCRQFWVTSSPQSCKYYTISSCQSCG